MLNLTKLFRCSDLSAIWTVSDGLFNFFWSEEAETPISVPCIAKIVWEPQDSVIFV